MTRAIGTPAFMAPELFQTEDDNEDDEDDKDRSSTHVQKKGEKDEAVPEKTDIYAIAIIMWMCWYREEPFARRGVHQILSRVCRGKRPLCKDLAKSNALAGAAPPDPLNKLIERCWSQNPQERPTAAETYDIFTKECMPRICGPEAQAEALVVGAATAASDTAAALHRATLSAFSFTQTASTSSLTHIGSFSFSSSLTGGSKGSDGNRNAPTSEKETPDDVPAFLEKAGLKSFAARLIAQGFDDVASLSDREVLSDKILVSKDIGMAKSDVIRFRKLIQTEGTSTSIRNMPLTGPKSSGNKSGTML